MDDLPLIRALASYHRSIAGLLWMIEDEIEHRNNYFPASFCLAVRCVLKYDRIVRELTAK